MNNIFYHHSAAPSSSSNYFPVTAPRETSVADSNSKIISTDFIPEENKLYSNLPSAFHQITRLKFDVNNQTNVKLTIYDYFGKKVVSLIDKQLQQGQYEVVFNNNHHNLPTGVYMYKLVTDDYAETKKMVLLKLINNNN